MKDPRPRLNKKSLRYIAFVPIGLTFLGFIAGTMYLAAYAFFLLPVFFALYILGFQIIYTIFAGIVYLPFIIIFSNAIDVFNEN